MTMSDTNPPATVAAGHLVLTEPLREQIPFERLDALPAVRSCVTCQASPRPVLR